MSQLNKKLEEYSWFPYVAWTLSIVFAIFVGSLALELRNTAQSIQDSTMTLDYRLQVVEEMFAEQQATTTDDIEEQTNE